ncbi:hypothetical protein PS938_01309 [Pseudomonas fluorescens]|uniref:Transmembrane protein n=1 Tax=Pseudomonas fluorescens TaxID=294 RepID=A0A5E7SM89_PSEFL|nr:hypothetical protein [Pseudomonas fluorescens]VVP87891.1 hypothetical protein PS938_01309 [Pseudomonas fluorescens]
MSKPAKIFFLGVFVSLIVLAVGYALDKREQSALDTLVVKCKNLVREAPNGPLQEWQKSPLVCEPTELMYANDLIGIQKDIAQSYWKRGDYFLWSQLLAVLLLGVLTLPYAWYSLLRRVRELVKAITGK